MKNLHNKFTNFFKIALSVILVINVSAQKPIGNQTQINPAALDQMKKASPKKPIAFAFDEKLKIPTARTADGTIMRLLPLEDVKAARENLQRMLTLPEQQAARRAIPLMLGVKPPAVVANLAVQTPPQHQGNRSTCGVFAAVAALESAYKRVSNRDYNFSEQHVNWLKNVTWMSSEIPNHSSQRNAASLENLPGSLSAGVSCVGILQMLTRYSAVEDDASPYIADSLYEDFSLNPIYREYGLSAYNWQLPDFPQKSVNDWNFAPAQMPEAARLYPLYGAHEVVALKPEEFRRTEVIESLVASGKDIVFAIQLYNATADSNPRDPVWRHAPGATEGGAHCMMIVGYDRNRRFFIVKNSYGAIDYDAAALDAQWRDVDGLYDNYVLLDYDHFSSDAYEAGYINEIKGTSINFEQRMLGLWDVTIRQKSTNRVVSSGTLAWRQKASYLNENGAAHVQLQQKSFRVGDYTDSNNRSYRVNGEIVHVQKLNLYIAFDRPNMAYNERGGIKIEGRWLGRSFGRQTIVQGTLTPTGFGSGIGTALGIHNVNGVPLNDLEFSAALRGFAF